MPRPWSRHSLKKQEKPIEEKPESIKSVSSNKKGAAKVKDDTDNGDLEFQEFLQVMQPRSKSKLWANDMVEANPGKDSNKKVQVDGKGKKKSKSAMLNEVNDELDSLSDGPAAERKSSVEHDKAVSDMDYFKSRVKKDWSDTDNEDEDDDGADTKGDMEVDNDDHGIKKSHDVHPESDDLTEKPNETDDVDQPSSSVQDDDDVKKTGRLFVRNLPYTATYVPYLICNSICFKMIFFVCF